MILSPKADPIERYVFDLSAFPVVPQSDLAAPFENLPDEEEEDEEEDSTVEASEKEDAGAEPTETLGPPLPELEEYLRGVLARLSTSRARLRALPQDCSFTIALDLKARMRPPEQVCGSSRMLLYVLNPI